MKKQIVIASLVSLIIGIFLGREILRYEIKRDMRQAIEGISESFKGVLGKSTSENKLSKNSKPNGEQARNTPKISALLITKEAVKNGYGQSLKITFAVSNESGKDIDAFKGRLNLLDGYGEKVRGFLIDEEIKIANGATVTITNLFENNQFVADHQKSVTIEKFSSVFTLTGALFSDGSKFVSEK